MAFWDGTIQGNAITANSAYDAGGLASCNGVIQNNVISGNSCSAAGGGVGLYLHGVFFALIADDALYFKVDKSSRSDYEEGGVSPFRPLADKPTVMQYYEVPVEVLEDGEKLWEWADKALRVAEKKAGGPG